MARRRASRKRAAPSRKAASGRRSRKLSGALGQWIAFVKRVQREENLSYTEAMKRAKARKNRGEQWRSSSGGGAMIAARPAIAASTLDSTVAQHAAPLAGGRRHSRRARRR